MSKVRHYFIRDWIDIEIDFCQWEIGVYWRKNLLRFDVLCDSFCFYWD